MTDPVTVVATIATGVASVAAVLMGMHSIVNRSEERMKDLFRAELKATATDSEKRLGEQIAALRQEMTEQGGGLRQNLADQVSGLRQNVADLGTGLRQELAGLENRMNAKLDRIELKLGDHTERIARLEEQRFR